MSVASQARYALLRSLDSAALYPLGVLYERDDGGAKLLTYFRSPWSMGLRGEYESFDNALETMRRTFLVSAVGREGEDADERERAAVIEGERRIDELERRYMAASGHLNDPQFEYDYRLGTTPDE